MPEISTDHLPKVAVFDLDYTLWPLWCDTHVDLPVKAVDGGQSLIDASGEQISFYKDVPDILKFLKDNNVKVVAASRTHRPDIAKDMLRKLKINGRPAIEIFDDLQWGTNSKILHFRQIQKSIGEDFHDMIFFDDESRNRDVTQLGVTFYLINERGVTWSTLDKAIKRWQGQKKSP